MSGHTRCGREAACARWLRRLGACAAVASCVWAQPAFASTTHDLRGGWSVSGSGGSCNAAVQTWDITTIDLSSGSFSGTGAGGPYTFPISGTASGDSLSFTTGPYDQLPSYTATFSGTIAADSNSMSGTFSDTNGLSGCNWSATRTSGPPGGGGGVLRPTTTTVQCDQLNPGTPDAYFDCHANVADTSGQSPPMNPTGSVTFSAINGNFPNGVTCTLQPLGNRAASCAVQYVPGQSVPTGTQPPVGASYPGDSTFASSSGGTPAPPAGTERPSATNVACSLFNPNSSNAFFECTASVGDASGQSPPKIPTGKVIFSAPTGTFPNGSVCNLQTDPTSMTAFCFVDYIPGGKTPTGTAPPVTANYFGDSVFNPSSAKAKTTVATGPPSGSPPPSGSLPGTPESRGPVNQTSLTPNSNLCTGSIPIYVPSASSDGAQAARVNAPRRTHTLSRSQADAAALRTLQPARRRSVSGVAVYALHKPLAAGSVITQSFAADVLTPQQGRAIRIRSSAWLFWEDLETGARYYHPSIVLLLDARTGTVAAQRIFDSPPLVNGHGPPYLRGPHRRYAIYFRVKPIRLSRNAATRVRAALRFALGFDKGVIKHAVDRKSSSLGQTTLITLVNREHYNSTDGFTTEEQMITGVFQQHGVHTTTAFNFDALKNAVGVAEDAGQTSVTVYLDGHGGFVNHNGKREVAVFVGGVDVNTTEDSWKHTTRPVFPGDLQALAEAHPNLKFNFIIESCHSGAFIDGLTAGNIETVTTSAAGNEEGTTFSNKRVAAFAPPDFTPPDPNQVDLSTFTPAEVKALDQTLGSAEASGTTDPSEALKQAQEIEPSYDAAAIQGATHPSTPWVRGGSVNGFCHQGYDFVPVPDPVGQA